MKKVVRINESELKHMIMESVKRVLNEDFYDDDDLNDYVNQFDEEGKSFTVKQYRFIVKKGFSNYEPVITKTNLSKEEAWNVFQEAAMNAAKEGFSNNRLLYPCRDFEYLCWPEVSTTISTIYGRETKVRYPNTDVRDIATAIYNIKNDNLNETWENFGKNFLERAKNTFFDGNYEYTSY